MQFPWHPAWRRCKELDLEVCKGIRKTLNSASFLPVKSSWQLYIGKETEKANYITTLQTASPVVNHHTTLAIHCLKGCLWSEKEKEMTVIASGCIDNASTSVT